MLSGTTLFKSVGIWALFVVIALLNATLREQLLSPMIGQWLALPLSGILLSALIFLMTLIMVPFLDVNDALGFWLVGALWLLLTLVFEFCVDLYVVGKTWESLLEVFNVLEGDLFAMVLITTAVSPYITAKMRNLV